MSWEDCGFKPGKVNGPARCPRQCGDCDGEHHFYAGFREDDDGEFVLDENGEPIAEFSCKHCDATATMVDEDEPTPETPDAMADTTKVIDWQDEMGFGF